MNENQQKIKQYLDEHKGEMMEFWKNLVNFQAGSKESERIAELMQKVSDRFQKEGFESELLPTGCPIPMLRAYKGKERSGKPILFCGHLDTVFPNGSYPENPFHEKDGKVYGPGTCDMKGGVVSLLYTIKILEELGYDRHPFKVVLVGDEETTHVGSRAADMLAEEAEGCLCAFNMETGRTTHQIVIARKGCMDVWITTHGKAGHVGNEFTKCANAVEAMAGIITKLRALTDLKEGRTVSTDVIAGGTASNVVPDKCRIEVDCRVDKNSDLDLLKEQITAICRQTDVPGTTAEVEFPSSMPVFEKSEGTMKLLALYNEAAGTYGIAPYEPLHPGGCSDASFLAKANIPILDSLGPEGEKEHTLQEFAYVDTLFTRTAVLVSTILQLD
jgi:glutamate carboxypeptidase